MLLVAAAIGATAAQSAGHPTYLTFITKATSANPSVSIAHINGSDQRVLGPGSSAMVSPDGSYVSVIAPNPTGTGTALEMYRTSGGAPNQLYTSSGFLTLLGWSADSKLLLLYAPDPSSGTGPLLAVSAMTGAHSTIATGAIEGASFSPTSADDVVFGLARTIQGTAANLFTSSASGADAVQITFNGHSSEPLWGPQGIVFSRARSRGPYKAPISQLWLTSAKGTGAKQLTHMTVGPLVSGLVPVALSANGDHLLASFEGEDTSASWTVDLSKHMAVVSDINHVYDGNTPCGISRDGKTVLYSTGFEGAAPSVDTVPWGGGKVTVLTRRGTGASWND